METAGQATIRLLRTFEEFSLDPQMPMVWRSSWF